MPVVVQIIGAWIMLMGVLLLVKPTVLDYPANFFKKGRRIYLAAVARLTLAVLFLLAAGDCMLRAVVALFGVLFMISGLLILMLGPARMREIIELFQRQPHLIRRVVAALVLAVGGLIAYAANPAG